MQERKRAANELPEVRCTSVHAEDLLLDACRKGQPVEQSVDARPCPHALGISQPLDAFYSEAEQSIDISGLCNNVPLFSRLIPYARNRESVTTLFSLKEQEHMKER